MDYGSIKYALCNETIDASIDDIRKPALMRWSIEQNFKECKNDFGMDQYETRSWLSWRCHILMTFISYLFILKLNHKFATKNEYQLETPIVTGPMDLNEYLDDVKNNQNEHPIIHNNVEVVVKSGQRIMTTGSTIRFINKFILSPK
jgi:hypothetical protein